MSSFFIAIPSLNTKYLERLFTKYNVPVHCVCGESFNDKDSYYRHCHSHLKSYDSQSILNMIGETWKG